MVLNRLTLVVRSSRPGCPTSHLFSGTALGSLVLSASLLSLSGLTLGVLMCIFNSPFLSFATVCNSVLSCSITQSYLVSFHWEER